MSLRCAPGRAARAVGNDTTVANGAEPPPRQGNDKAKYDKALKLAQQIGKIEKEIMRKMKGSNDKAATVAYLIFKLAMRVGDEKDPDEE